MRIHRIGPRIGRSTGGDNFYLMGGFLEGSCLTGGDNFYLMGGFLEGSCRDLIRRS